MSSKNKPWYKKAIVQRIVFISLAIACYPAMSFIIQVISDISGLSTYNYGQYFVLNSWTGPIVMGSFVVIIFFIGLSMAFIFKAFGAHDELPID
ncbi:MAG: hypothetical protein ACFFE6_03810 [Candidatus Thorarchaeota archaeon]